MSAQRRLAIAFAVTLTLLLAEIVGAVLTSSLALLTDAGHMLTDVLGLGIALFASRLMTRPATDNRTWGFLRAEVMAAGAQATILLAVGLFAVVEGVRRLVTPEPVSGGALLVFGLIGLIGNLVAAVVLHGAHESSLNMRAAMLEVVNDALGSVAVIVSALVVSATGYVRADAIAGLFIAALILPRSLRILAEAGDVLLETTPRGLDLDVVRRHIGAIEHVVAVHDLHASRISTRLPVLTAHIQVQEGCFRDGHAPEILAALQECLARDFDVSHSTFQLEPVGEGTTWQCQQVTCHAIDAPPPAHSHSHSHAHSHSRAHPGGVTEHAHPDPSTDPGPVGAPGHEHSDPSYDPHRAGAPGHEHPDPSTDPGPVGAPGHEHSDPSTDPHRAGAPGQEHPEPSTDPHRAEAPGHEHPEPSTDPHPAEAPGHEHPEPSYHSAGTAPGPRA